MKNPPFIINTELYDQDERFLNLKFHCYSDGQTLDFHKIVLKSYFLSDFEILMKVLTEEIKQKFLLS